jgi:hypothetical protein
VQAVDFTHGQSFGEAQPLRQAFVTIMRKTQKIGFGQNFCVAQVKLPVTFVRL